MDKHSTIIRLTRNKPTAACAASAEPEPSDESLWVAAQSGRQDAFAQLYRRYEILALRVAARVCGPDAAEDAVQAAFFSLWRNRSSFHPSRGSLRTWVLSAVRHRAIDVVRERRRRPTVHMEDEHFADSAVAPLPEVEIAARETGVAVRDAVAELPAAQREVIELAYFAEYSQAEIASALRVPLGTVKGRTRLAFEKLPERLGAHRQDPFATAI